MRGGGPVGGYFAELPQLVCYTTTGEGNCEKAIPTEVLTIPLA